MWTSENVIQTTEWPHRSKWHVAGKYFIQKSFFGCHFHPLVCALVVVRWSGHRSWNVLQHFIFCVCARPQLEKFGNVVNESKTNWERNQQRFEGKILCRMAAIKISFQWYTNCNHYRANPSDVSKSNPKSRIWCIVLY